MTNAQYLEFLNAKARSDPLVLYNTNMEVLAYPNLGGITRSGVSGSYTYAAINGREDMPVNLVSFFDALRFANWMHNGQGSGDTETGAYTLLGGTPIPSNSDTVARTAGATILLPTEDEWHKAAYYDETLSTYLDYPASFDSPTTCSTPTAIPNSGNCDSAVGDLTPIGSYVASQSPYGTFDQGGNVFEWTEKLIGTDRRVSGASWSNSGDRLAAAFWGHTSQEGENNDLGFRLVLVVPESGTGLLVVAGLVGFAGWGRERA